MWLTGDQGDIFLLCIDHLSACDVNSLFLDRGEVSTTNILFLFFVLYFGISCGNISSCNKLPNSALSPNSSLLTDTPFHSVRGSGLLLHVVIQGPKLMETLPSSTCGDQGFPGYHQPPRGYSMEEAILHRRSFQVTWKWH